MQLLWTDFPALASWIGVIVVWVFYFVEPLIMRPSPNDEYLVWVPAISTLGLTGVLAWRTQQCASGYAAVRAAGPPLSFCNASVTAARSS